MDLRVLNPKDPLPRSQDYILEKMAEYNKLLPIIKYPKLDGGKWKVTILSLEIKEIREIIKNPEPSCVELILLVAKDAYRKILMETPRQKSTAVSKWEIYLETIGGCPLSIEDKAVSELYSRTGGDISKVSGILKELEEIFLGQPIITVKELNAVVLDGSKVYAGDVLKALLLEGNLAVPPKGSMLSKYVYKKWNVLYDDLVEQIGVDFAFYSMRSYIKKLYDAKLMFLENKDVPKQFTELVEFVDVYEVMHAYILFQASNPLQTVAVLHTIKGRKKSDVGLLQIREALSVDVEHYGPSR